MFPCKRNKRRTQKHYFLGEDFLAGEAFLAGDFLTAFLGLALAFFALGEAAFLATVFFTGDFLAGDFLAATVFLTAVFLATAAFLGAATLAFLGAAEVFFLATTAFFFKGEEAATFLAFPLPLAATAFLEEAVDFLEEEADETFETAERADLLERAGEADAVDLGEALALVVKVLPLTSLAFATLFFLRTAGLFLTATLFLTGDDFLAGDDTMVAGLLLDLLGVRGVCALLLFLTTVTDFPPFVAKELDLSKLFFNLKITIKIK